MRTMVAKYLLIIYFVLLNSGLCHCQISSLQRGYASEFLTMSVIVKFGDYALRLMVES